MACAMCEHCLGPITADETVVIREGFSYHKTCLKCYVCSETNLHNAEVFKGVIFCSSCAQRIFQSCASVRRNKQYKNNRVKRANSKPRRKHARPKPQEKVVEKPMNGVIELARLAGSSSGSNNSLCEKLNRKLPLVKRPSIVAQLALQVAKEVLDYSDIKIKQSLKKDSVEMGVTTEVTQDLLTQMKIDESFVNPNLPEIVQNTRRDLSPVRPRKRRKDITAPKTHIPICSDLRMAELGASTEIANMTLRKRSEMPVVIKSTTELKETQRRREETERERKAKSYSHTVLQQEMTDILGDANASDSAYSTYNPSTKTTYLDRRLGSILKLPYNFFKTNILNRSSLISVLMSSDEENKNTILKRLKMLFYEEITEHQGRGIKRLYSTINRRKTPYRLGWLHLKNITNVISRERMRQSKSNEVPEKKCKHIKNSHSYRCMRAQAMRLAGPTKSQLACVRRKMKRVIAPKVVRDVLKCLCDVEDPLPREGKNYDLQTVFKARTSSEASEKRRKIYRKENKLQQLGERYVNLWSLVV